MNSLVSILVSMLSIESFSILFLIFIILFINVRLCMKKSILPQPPGPFGVPFFGYLFFLGQDFHLTLTTLSKKYGSVFQLNLGRIPIVVINDAKIIQQAFRLPIFSGRPHTELTKILQGYGIVNSNGELWQEQRKFLHKILRKLGAKSLMQGKNCLEHKIQAEVQDFLSDLTYCKSNPCRIRPFIARSISNIVGSLLMSMTFKSSEDKIFRRLLEVIEEGHKLFTIAMPVNFLPFLRFVPKVNFAYYKIKQNRNETSKYFKEIMDEHKKSLNPEHVRDFVDAYLIEQNELKKSGKDSHFSEEQLVQIMNDIFSTGLETVTTTLEWAVLFIMINTKVQRKIQNEIDNVVGKHRMPQLDDIQSMPYTEATIWEVLRRSNVVALGNAHATTDDASLNGYFIPAGTHVISNLYAINMDSKLWGDPETFRPERFLKNGKFFKPPHFMPFSVGRRMCLGDMLSRMEMFLFLSSLLQSFNLCVPSGEAPTIAQGIAGASLTPTPFEVCLVSRNN